MPQTLTHNQVLYRAYLTTPVWQAKRAEALVFYGCICARCKGWGNDVHHKTYERVGGSELIEDLEVMCRECHQAHHAIERFAGKPRKQEPRGIHRRAIYAQLTGKHAEILLSEFPNVKNLYVEINTGEMKLAHRAARLLGCDYAYGTIRIRKGKHKRRFWDGNPLITKEEQKNQQLIGRFARNCVDKRRRVYM